MKKTKTLTRGKVITLLGALASASSGTMAVAQTLVVRFITLGVNILSGVISARFLGPVGRAEQAAILLGAGLFPYILSFGLPLAIQYNVRTDPKLESKYVSAGTALSIALGVLAAVVGFFALPHMLGKYPPTIVFAAQCGMLIAPVTMLYMLLSSILQARGRFRETNFTRYAMPASTVLILVVLIVAHRLNPVTSSIAYLVTGLWAVPWLWARVKPRLRLRGLKQASKGLPELRRAFLCERHSRDAREPSRSGARHRPFESDQHGLLCRSDRRGPNGRSVLQFRRRGTLSTCLVAYEG